MYLLKRHTYIASVDFRWVYGVWETKFQDIELLISRKNKDIVLLKPDKENGVVILDRRDYDLGIQNIIQDSSKFKPLSQDPTLQREGKL